MNMPFLKCISCSKNNGNTQIKIRSNCLSKSIIINLDSNHNNNLVLIQSILDLIINNKKEENNPEEVII